MVGQEEGAAVRRTLALVVVLIVVVLAVWIDAKIRDGYAKECAQREPGAHAVSVRQYQICISSDGQILEDR